MKALLTATACALSLTAAMAHAGKGPPASEEERAARMERMKQHLQLSDEQVAEMRRIREEGGGRKEMRAVLTDDQREKWDQARERHRQQKQANTGD